jgi:beta-N-acetylhexosaminidase
MRKQRIRLLSVALLSLLALTGCGSKQAEPSKPETPPPTSVQPVSPSPQPVVSEPQKPVLQEPPKTVNPAAELVAQMSLTEKIGQMVLVGMDGTAVQPEISTLIKGRRVGGIILYSNNIVSPAQTDELVNGLKKLN